MSILATVPHPRQHMLPADSGHRGAVFFGTAQCRSIACRFGLVRSSPSATKRCSALPCVVGTPYTESLTTVHTIHVRQTILPVGRRKPTRVCSSTAVRVCNVKRQFSLNCDRSLGSRKSWRCSCRHSAPRPHRASATVTVCSAQLRLMLLQIRRVYISFFVVPFAPSRLSV